MSAAGSATATATTARCGEPRFKAPLPFAVQVVLAKAGKAPRFIPKGQTIAHEDMMNKQGALKTHRWPRHSISSAIGAPLGLTRMDVEQGDPSLFSLVQN
jgi:hypothetical protein